MDEQTQVQEPVAAVEEVTAPPAEAPVAEPAPEAPVAPEVQPEVPAQPQQEPVDPAKDFLDAYKALCQEKGYEISFEAKPVFNKELGVYDFSQVRIVYDVAKLQ